MYKKKKVSHSLLLHLALLVIRTNIQHFYFLRRAIKCKETPSIGFRIGFELHQPQEFVIGRL